MNEKKRKGIIISLIIIVMIALAAVLLTMFSLTGAMNGGNVKIGFIIIGGMDDTGWNGMNYQGIREACDSEKVTLLVKENVPEGTGECEAAVRELIDEGAGLIILTSYNYADEVRDLIQSSPDISFYCTASSFAADNLTVYMGRMYQIRYLTGIVAGLSTETNQIGYVAAMDNSEVNRGISAFALGVRSVNRDASIHVAFTDAWDDREREMELTERLISDCGIDLITYHQDQTNVIEAAENAGICSIGYHETASGVSENYLTAAVWNLKRLYSTIIEEFLQGKANTSARLWFGIDSGVVGLAEYSPRVSEEAKRAVEAAREDMLAGRDVFSGVIYDNQGNMRCGEGEIISDEQLLEHFDWYAEGVEIYDD